VAKLTGGGGEADQRVESGVEGLASADNWPLLELLRGFPLLFTEQEGHNLLLATYTYSYIQICKCKRLCTYVDYVSNII
jgi:hypothetical protein